MSWRTDFINFEISFELSKKLIKIFELSKKIHYKLSFLNSPIFLNLQKTIRFLKFDILKKYF